jgi:(5-formylfuran-3-yl)methyl phosphate synthase
MRSARPIPLGTPDLLPTNHVAKLLVSVRSKVEALAALAGGATIIDVKEPKNGSLGQAPFDVWREVRAFVPQKVPVSVALGELHEWSAARAGEVPSNAWSGLAFRKFGLAHAPPDWIDRWRSIRRLASEFRSATPAWVAVVYIDWQAACAPHPDSIIQAASTIEECQGVLFDTWDKSRGIGIDLAWQPQIDHVRDSGRFVALAGSLDADAIRRLAPLRPDIFAVRGSACARGDRLGPIDPDRVSVLARAARSLGP